MNNGFLGRANLESLEIDGSVLVLHNELLHLLSGSSAEIWQEVDGTRTASEVAALLGRRHPESTEVLQDVADFVTDLTQRGLLVERDDPDGTGYRVPGHVAWAAEDDGSIALADLRSGRRSSLPSTGGMIWTMTVSGSPHAVVEAEIREAFPDAPDGWAEDVRRLLDSLVDAGLLERQMRTP